MTYSKRMLKVLRPERDPLVGHNRREYRFADDTVISLLS